jgi:multiple sugar transport system ATP-binding protein
VADIVLDRITKRFPDGALAVDNISLDIADGEFVILVGPSGCGKSTTLNMIAGLEDISDGELRIGGQVVNNKAPKDRDIAMVFQSYALYPHMTVRENMAFALKLSKTPQSVIDQKVEEAARVLDLTQHLDRKPANLSGGQRQRVAMGRAIVRDPAAFLMDEPLSNLDAKLRVQMRTEVSRLQKRLGTTTVYVTHDQTEAMTLGDRVAVMRGGKLQQVGPPQELYDAPANLFVAGFIGSPAMNFLPATVEQGMLRTNLGDIPLRDELRRSRDRGAATSSSACVPRASRTPRSCRALPTAPASRSPRRSTCWSRWAPTSTRTSRSKAATSAGPPRWRSSTATRAGPTPGAMATRWSHGSTRRPGSARASGRSCGSTYARCTCSTPTRVRGSAGVTPRRLERMWADRPGCSRAELAP